MCSAREPAAGVATHSRSLQPGITQIPLLIPPFPAHSYNFLTGGLMLRQPPPPPLLPPLPLLPPSGIRLPRNALGMHAHRLRRRCSAGIA